MQRDDDSGVTDRSVVSVRAMEIAVALLFIAVAAVVVADSLRIGIGWVDLEGPPAGYFPFYVGVFMALGSAVTLAQALFSRGGPGESFVGRNALLQVFLVLVPLSIYVVLTAFVGIYVSSALYIGAFMIYFGRYGWLRSFAISAGLAVVLFLVFEKWFLLPLPKGPLEDLLGY
jgi:hypothetical protein